jgi:UDP-2,3-diacylglucosamine pyrophosphatase LpxH
MKFAKIYYLSALAGVLFLVRPALADPKADDASYVNAENFNMLLVDKWATETRNELKNAGRTNEEKLKRIQAGNTDFLNNVEKPCRDDAQARKLEAYIHKKFHEFSDVAAEVTHGVNMSCSPDHKLRPTLWITKFTLSGPALADPKADEAYANAEKFNMLLVDKWATDTRNALKRTGRTNDEKLKNIQAGNTDFLNNVEKTCRDDAQARKLEAYIHKKFHEFSDVAADVTHGVNMSCSPDHKLRPTLWITKFTLKS